MQSAPQTTDNSPGATGREVHWTHSQQEGWLETVSREKRGGDPDQTCRRTPFTAWTGGEPAEQVADEVRWESRTRCHVGHWLQRREWLHTERGEVRERHCRSHTRCFDNTRPGEQRGSPQWISNLSLYQDHLEVSSNPHWGTDPQNFQLTRYQMMLMPLESTTLRILALSKGIQNFP